MMEMRDYLTTMVSKGASDLYLVTGAAPSIKIDAEVVSIADIPLETGRTKQLAYGLMSDEQIARFEQFPELNIAISENEVGRFRVNVSKQRGETSIVARHIKTNIPSMEALHLPKLLASLVMQKNGLILFVGATGTGKSTSLASMIDYRNQQTTGHIVTVEDPIEFIHKHNKSIITQREVGVDTESYEDALKNTLRQAPSVILIGEVRDRETMRHAISFSETGHLCMTTLHAANSNQALERVLHFFPEDRREQLLLDLSLNLVAIISQRLIPGIEGGLVPAFEILLATPLVKDLIKRNEIPALREVMEKGTEVGMQTFDACLFRLYNEDKITVEEALKNAESQNNLRIAIQMQTKELSDRLNHIEDNYIIVPKQDDDLGKF